MIKTTYDRQIGLYFLNPNRVDQVSSYTVSKQYKHDVCARCVTKRGGVTYETIQNISARFAGLKLSYFFFVSSFVRFFFCIFFFLFYIRQTVHRHNAKRYTPCYTSE